MKKILLYHLILSLVFSLIVSPTVALAHDQLQDTQWEKRDARSESWFFEDLPRHIGNDLRESFFRGGPFLFLAGGALATILIHEADSSIQKSFYPSRPLGKGFDGFVDKAFNPIVLGGVSLVTLGVAKLTHSDKVAVTSGTMLEALSLTEAITLPLKYATNRRRPNGEKYSFPSAHASGAFALASVAEVFYGPRWGIPSYALATLVSVSRIDGNYHFASDVMAGAVLGALIGFGTAKFHKKEFSRFFLSPVVGNNTTGLSMTYLFN